VTSARANRRGMFALMGAMATFAINDMLVKLTAQRYPLGEVITVRGIIATLMVGTFLIGMGHVASLRFGVQRIILVRTAFDGAAMVLFTTALINMPLAELSAVNLVSPLIITALAVIFFREEVGWRRWTAISIGFIGTLLIVKPAAANFNAWALLGIVCAFAGAARDIITRKLDHRIPTLVISFMAAAGSAIIGAIMGLFEDWKGMALSDVGMYFAVLSAIGPVALAVTTNLNINFLRKPPAGDLVVETRLLKLGRRLAVGEVYVRSGDSPEVISQATVTYSIPPER